MSADGDLAGRVVLSPSDRFAWRFWDESVVFYDEWSGETVLLSGAVSYVFERVVATKESGGCDISALQQELANLLEQPVDDRICAGVSAAVSRLREFDLVQLETP